MGAGGNEFLISVFNTKYPHTGRREERRELERTPQKPKPTPGEFHQWPLPSPNPRTQRKQRSVQRVWRQQQKHKFNSSGLPFYPVSSSANEGTDHLYFGSLE